MRARDAALRTTRLALPVLVAVAAGCAAALSPAVRREATPVKGLDEIRTAPDAFRGKIVILGGEIVETRNRADATTLVVLEKPLDVSRRPRDVDATGGRFQARFTRYLDPVVYAKGRLVTLAGAVSGEASEPVGEAPYRYVVLEGVEIHLWPARRQWDSPGYRDPWWYDGPWGERPW